LSAISTWRLLRQLHFATTTTLLALSFSVDHYDKKDKIRLFYRIKQLNEDWHAIDASNSLQFAGLPAGKYQLEVTTQGSTGNLNQGQLIIPIHVLQAYYKTPIAYSVYAAVANAGPFHTVQVIPLPPQYEKEAGH
jgi:hypothetical protein